MKYKDKNENEITIDENYDFTEETIGYKKSSKLKTKFVSKEISNIEKHSIYCQLSNVDPDSNSILLQNIYRNKWNQKYLETCIRDKNKNIYYSDVMTSLQGLLNHFYENICKDEWEDYKRKYSNVKYFGKDSMKKMVENITDYPKFKEYFVDNKIITDFIKYYHTIGNYIPVPKDFNKNRSGNYADHDMWDLTLTKIYNYYHNKKVDLVISSSDNALMELLFCDEKVLSTKKWLDSFYDWKTFIKENYLQAYVDRDTGIIKKEFTDIHNWKNGETYPNSKDSFLAYFKYLTDAIKSRSNDILENKKVTINDINETL